MVTAPLLTLLVALALLAPGMSAHAAPKVASSAANSVSATTAAVGATQAKRVQKATKHRAKKHRVNRCAKLQRAGKKYRASQCRKARHRAHVRAAKIRAEKIRAAKAKAAAAAKAKAKPPVVVTPPVVPPVVGGTSGDVVRVANANIKFGLSAALFNADLARVVSTAPDFVTLNEAGPRTAAQLTPSGYAHYRPTPARINGNAVLWRTDRWSMVSQGYRVIVDDGPMKYDKNRGASWATLEGLHGEGRISVVSTHHMQNPAKFGPNKALRQQLYTAGMYRLRSLVAELSAQGPVFVAGDFNSGFRTFDTWSPRAMFAPLGVKAAMDTMPVVPTHDGGGIIDYVFYQAARATVLNQTVTNIHSDHHMILNDFQLIG